MHSWSKSLRSFIVACSQSEESTPNNCFPVFLPLHVMVLHHPAVGQLFQTERDPPLHQYRAGAPEGRATQADVHAMALWYDERLVRSCAVPASAAISFALEARRAARSPFSLALSACIPYTHALHRSVQWYLFPHIPCRLQGLSLPPRRHCLLVLSGGSYCECVQAQHAALYRSAATHQIVLPL